MSEARRSNRIDLLRKFRSLIRTLHSLINQSTDTSVRDSLHPSFATGARLRAVLNVNNSFSPGPTNFPNIRIRHVYQCFPPPAENRLVLAYVLHPWRRTRNVAVIGRKRSLRIPEMTPAFLVRSISPGRVRTYGRPIPTQTIRSKS